MLVFLAIAIGGAILVVGGAIFGHDHEVDHSFDHDHDHSGHDGDHGSNMPTVSIFSMKVLGTFVMGFGGAGFLAKFRNWGTYEASGAGVAFGLLLGAAMYGVMRLAYAGQSDSLIYTKETVGKNGISKSDIYPGQVGEVEISFGDLSKTYLARTNSKETVSRGTKVRVTEYHGSELVVESVAN